MAGRYGALLSVAAWCCLGAGAFAQCGANWSNQFDATFFPGGANAMVTHDDGSGPALYIGSGNHPQYQQLSVVRYRGPGLPLETVGGGVNVTVRDLAVYDDGGGPKLYATGNFTIAGGVACSYIAKWDGTAWSPLGSGLDGVAYTLAVYDDGTGPALFVGGEFSHAGGVSASRLAKWNGSAWSSVTPFVTSGYQVRTLAVFNPGTGNRLYVAGQFTAIGGVNAAKIASFDGTTWSALGSGFPNNDYVEDLQVYDPGTGAQLYACGWFASAAGVAASNIARWNGSAWSGLGSGIDSGGAGMTVWNTPSGPRLVVGGTFWNAGGVLTGGVALFDGSIWSSVNAQGRTANVVGTFNPGGGERLYTVGTIGDPVPNGGGTTFQTWYPFQSCFGGTWTAPNGKGLSGSHVLALETHDDGSGPKLYAGGYFVEAGGNYARNVARWNGSAWSPLGNPAGYQTFALKSFDDGTGPALYRADNSVEKWNGATWASVGPTFNVTSTSLAVYDAGAGPSLYAGGYFTAAGGVTLNCVARLSGATWVPLGSGVSLPGGNPVVSALTVFDDGSGPALYAGGMFSSAGGFPANNIAKWNGTSWSTLGSGFTGGATVKVNSLVVYDDGTGPALYAGGIFTQAGGLPSPGLAKWNGSTWSAPGGGVSGVLYAMRVFDDLTGPRLYVTGNFAQAGTTVASNIARWNGTSFEALGSGLQGAAQGALSTCGFALGQHAFPSGPSLFVGGNFTTAGGNPSDLIAEIIPARPGLSMTQPGGAGSGILVANTSLKIGFETYNIFSLEPAPGGPGAGPYVGLYATNLAPLLTQFFLPLGTIPFHFTATSASASFGPYAGYVPSGAVIEGLTFQVSGCIGTVSQIVVQ
jgi:hypothetical protein